MDDPTQGQREAGPGTDDGDRTRVADPQGGGSIGDQLGRDLGNLGDDVPTGADRTFPDTPISDKTM